MAIITGTSASEVLNGTASADEISGLGGADTLTGAGGNDTLLGGTGSDSLVGGTGADSLDGGSGNDTYVIDASDNLSEASGAGSDTVRADFSYALLANFENLVLTGTAAINGTGNTANNVITGNNVANVLVGDAGHDALSGNGGSDTLDGGSGNDTLDGGNGIDSLTGGLGNDTYVVTNGDVVVELAGSGQGSADLVQSALTYTLLDNFERLTLTGTSDVAGTGNTLKNLITGNTGANLLDGGSGNDTLDGGAGADSLTGGLGSDTLVHDGADVSVQGGAGTDALRFVGGGTTLDLTAVADAVHSDIEVINLTGSGNNSLKLAQADLLALSTSTNILRVNGNAGDAVSTGDSGWTWSQNLVLGAQTYAVYANGTAILRVDSDIDRSGIRANFGTDLDLSILDGAHGFRLDGAAAGDFSGYSVSAAGDVNGDGFGDLVIGARSADPNGYYAAGATYVVFGAASGFASSMNLSALDGTNGFRLEGKDGSDRSGGSVSGAGDVNGDGFADMIVGADGANPDGPSTGVSYVVFGTGTGFAASVNLSTLDGNNGFRLDGEAADDSAGISVSGAGDVNGDGFDDLILGALGADPNGDFSGASYVVFGKASGFTASLDVSTLDGTNGFRLDGIAPSDFSGGSVSAAGDLNGDGFDDLVVGAQAAYGSAANSGAAYVVFGKASGFAATIDLSALGGSAGFRLGGVAGGDNAGVAVSDAGDVNGDGLGDLIVGAAFAGASNYGASYLVFGRATGFGSGIDLSSLDGGNGFRLEGAQGSDVLGGSVSVAGDVNGDGFDDLIVGARGADYGSYAGAGYVVFGKASGFAASINVSTLDGADGFKLSGVAGNDLAGFSVSGAGDVNGDGFDDLIVSARDADPNGTSSGSSYIVFGGDFTGAVTHLGTGGADSLTGSGAAETFVAGRGNDTINGGGGADVIRGGQGSDQILVSNTNFADIDGGAGIDTLRILGSGRTLDLTARANNELTGIERINISGGGNNTLVLSNFDLFDLSDTSNQLRVDGDVDDTVDLDGAWGTGAITGGYQTYTLGAATILIDTDIFVT